MGVGREREKFFDAFAWWLYRRGVRPTHISFLQVPVFAAIAYVGVGADTQAELWGFFFLEATAFIIDGADGILARRTGTVTHRGHLVDMLFDITGIGITIWVVGVHYPQYNQWLYLLLIVNFLVYIQNEIQGTKSITYTRGPLTVGFVLAPYSPLLVPAGIGIPLVIGGVLLVTRVAWRKRLWTYYQFLTAGQRKEYKAVPRAQRVELLSQDPRYTAPKRPPGRPAPEREPTAGPDVAEEPPTP